MRGHKAHAIKVEVARSSFPLLISSSPQAHFCLTQIHVRESREEDTITVRVVGHGVRWGFKDDEQSLDLGSS